MPSGKDEVKESGQMPIMMPVQSFGKRHNHLKKRSAGDAKRSVVVRRTNITKVFCKFARASFVGLFMLTQMPCANSCPPYLSDHQVAVGGNHTACLQLTSGIDYAVYVDDFFIGLCNLFNGLGQGSVENEYHNNYQVSVNNTDCCVTLYKVSCGDKSICAKATGINNSVCCSLPVQCYPHVDHDNNVPVWVPVLVSFAVVSAVALLMILIWCICKNKSKKMYPQLRNSMFYHKV
ncbi:hypothetical protein DPMN_161428 [Dreissena polymorpha]|uniref:Uncharacterized protein n=2 Tax=Dreissena polymorpha TaxID=45954 RepID=A0A9D4ENX2_DREPO|nr:hypothetical protein DPMN_161428 [Dreissena polymorpha]